MAPPTTPTLTPTHHTGATTRSLPDITVDPARWVSGEEVGAPFEPLGLNSVFVADLLSAVAQHERCGTHLYRSVAARSLNPVLSRRYEELGEETLHHVELAEGLIAALGGDPGYVSPMARAVEVMDSSLLESTFLAGGSVDVMTQEGVMLDAVLIAETVDHQHWSMLSRLVADLPEGDLRERMAAVIGEVESQEDDHLAWARQAKERMVLMQARHPVVATAMAGAEGLAATVRDWFDE
jgi:rubrerythrin